MYASSNLYYSKIIDKGTELIMSGRFASNQSYFSTFSLYFYFISVLFPIFFRFENFENFQILKKWKVPRFRIFRTSFFFISVFSCLFFSKKYFWNYFFDGKLRMENRPRKSVMLVRTRKWLSISHALTGTNHWYSTSWSVNFG